MEVERASQSSSPGGTVLRATQERYREHGSIGKRLSGAIQFFRICEDSEDRGTTACHRRRFCAQAAQALFDSFEFGMPGEDDFFKVVPIYSYPPDFPLETIQFIL